ncbi:hydroxyacid dehydrogenase [Microbacterium sp.]|uniref:hydroxyacid dehydrogenase n=1 Tax=Microbacterium sp. TaxID=51671 RepID=UPI00281255E1|nr:hydroxyacid dehydrogenase [Microbacterium sp.]
MNRQPRVAFAMSREDHASAFPASLLAELSGFAEIVTPEPLTELESTSARAVLAETEILITGWGAPRIDATTIGRAPRLRAIVHAAGTVRPILDPAVYDLGIRVSSCASANAVPVAEFALASVIFGLKRASRFAAQLRETKGVRDVRGMPAIGAHRVVVGVIGASRVGREMMRMLRTLDVEILLSDPYVSPDDARDLGVTLVDLPELCRRSDAVTVHAPLTDQTVGMIGAHELSLMRDGAVLVNTARGALVDTGALTAELVSGRLDAYLDVVDPEPLPADSPLYDLPNVVITPHIAGALGNEVARLGELAVAETARFAADGTFEHEVRSVDLAIIA